MNAMRARLLLAMGISPLVGGLVACPQAREPSPGAESPDANAVATGTAATTTTTTTVAPLDASIEPPAVATADAASPSPDVPLVATIDAGTPDAKTPPKKPGIAPFPKDAWYLTYPLAKPPQTYCPNGAAVCVPLAWAVEHYGKAGQSTCPSEIVEACRCAPGTACKGNGLGLDEEDPCVDTFHAAVTNKERAAGKKNACCYAEFVHCTPPWVGRALRDDDGRTRVAPVEQRTDWSCALAARAALCDADRALVAAHFAEVASGEHASVASFAHVSLELMTHGAPAALLADTHRAALDEIEHARLAYSLASAYRGASVGPGPLAIARVPSRSLAELAASTVRDACIPEAIGAVLVAEVARLATAPDVRAAMERIAEDEARHAELAFRTLAWTLRVGGADVARAIDEASATAQMPTASTSAPLVSHGLLGTEAERSLIELAMRTVVRPCLAALLTAAR